MATARKKQDEKNLKTLRELVSLPANKECFDCHQRGPTYVNMTIGSFVCTSCSGLLRGLTPPHRVKSISMATFTDEEIDTIKSKGNDHCRRIWLGLYDSNNVSNTKDEQQIKDFMIAKYEKKRYYLEPSATLRNGPVNFSPTATQNHSRTSTPTPTSITSIPENKPLSSLLGSQAKPLVLNVKASSNPANNMFTPDQPSSEFLAGFGSADPFSSSNSSSATSQASFANFDNNPVFSSPTSLMFSSAMNSSTAAVHPKYNTNRWSMPTAAALSGMSSPFPSPVRKATSSVGLQPPVMANAARPPAEDRYAALKDLDSLMKAQQNPEPHIGEWSDAVSSGGSTWSVKNDSSSFGSPASSSNTSMEGSFFESASTNTANPFAASNHQNPWAVPPAANTVPNNSTSSNAFVANPFQARSAFAAPAVSEASFGWGTIATPVPNGRIPNGFHSDFSNAFSTSQPPVTFPSKMWQHQFPASAGNPFAVGASQPPKIHPSNPFL